MLWSGSSEGVGRWMPKLFCWEEKKKPLTLHYTLHIHFLISRFISEKLQKYPPVLSRHPAIFPLISFTRSPELDSSRSGQPWSADPLPAPSRIPPRSGTSAWVSGRLTNIIHTQYHAAAGCAVVPRPASHRRSHCLLVPLFRGAAAAATTAAACEIGCMRDGWPVVCCPSWHCNFSVHDGAMPAVQCAGAMRSVKMEHLRLCKGSCITLTSKRQYTILRL